MVWSRIGKPRRFQGMPDLFSPDRATNLLYGSTRFSLPSAAQQLLSFARTEGASDEIHRTPVEEPSASLSARLASRRPVPVRCQERVGSGILRGPHGQRFESRNPGVALRQPSEGKQFRRRGRYHLDACGNLLQHEPDQSLEERNIGYQPHQDLGVSGRGASSRLLAVPDDHSGGQHSGHPRDWELDAPQGTRDRQQ